VGAGRDVVRQGGVDSIYRVGHGGWRAIGECIFKVSVTEGDGMGANLEKGKRGRHRVVTHFHLHERRCSRSNGERRNNPSRGSTVST
jgi:hypothetical protein